MSNKATVYAYIGHNRGVAVDSEGNRKRNKWIELNLELDMEETIEKLAWRSSDDKTSEKGTYGGWGSNVPTIRNQDLDKLTGTVLTLCDAMIGDKEQRNAWKSILRKTIHEWYDEKNNRYNLSIESSGLEVN